MLPLDNNGIIDVSATQRFLIPLNFNSGVATVWSHFTRANSVSQRKSFSLDPANKHPPTMVLIYTSGIRIIMQYVSHFLKSFHFFRAEVNLMDFTITSI